MKYQILLQKVTESVELDYDKKPKETFEQIYAQRTETDIDLKAIIDAFNQPLTKK